MTMTTDRAVAAELRERYVDVTQFLARDARLLDENKLWEWYETLEEDFVYEIPMRLVRDRAAPTEFSPGSHRMKDSKGSLKKRIERIYTGHAWAEDPPSRTVRLVGSTATEAGESADLVVATSSLVVYRERGQNPDYDLIAGQRRDVIRFVNDQPRLAARTVFMAHTILNTPNLGIFL